MKFHIYQDKKGEWRWRLRTRNGKNIADSAEGYKRKSDCLKMIHKIIWYANAAKIKADTPKNLIDTLQVVD